MTSVVSTIDTKSAMIGLLVFAIPALIVVFANKTSSATVKATTSRFPVMNLNKLERMTTLKIDELSKDKEIWLCRCWMSSTYPYCDGAHHAHNKETGDTVGPLFLKRD
jgi:CDGSH-type Zn-finger protein